MLGVVQGDFSQSRRFGSGVSNKEFARRMRGVPEVGIDSRLTEITSQLSCNHDFKAGGIVKDTSPRAGSLQILCDCSLPSSGAKIVLLSNPSHVGPWRRAWGRSPWRDAAPEEIEEAQSILRKQVTRAQPDHVELIDSRDRVTTLRGDHAAEFLSAIEWDKPFSLTVSTRLLDLVATLPILRLGQPVFSTWKQQRVPFGRHKGQTLGWLADHRPDWIRWANRQGSFYAIHDAVEHHAFKMAVGYAAEELRAQEMRDAGVEWKRGTLFTAELDADGKAIEYKHIDAV